MQLLVVLIAVSCLVFTSALPSNKVFRFESYHDDTDDVVDLLKRPTQLDRNKPLHLFWKWGVNPDTRLKSFSYKDCGNASSILTVKDLKVTPDPISLPGTVNIGFNIDFAEDITGGLSAKVEMEKKIGIIKIPIPCIGNLGSCTYDDLCALMSQITECPQPFLDNNIPCKCPFEKNDYVMPPSDFDLQVEIIPSGDYYITAHFKLNGTFAGCLQVDLSVA